MTTKDIPLLGSPPSYFRCTQVGTDSTGNPIYVLGVALDGTDSSSVPVAIDQTTPGTTNGVAPDGFVDGLITTGSATSAAAIVTNTITKGAGYVVYQFTSLGGGSQTVQVKISNDGGATWTPIDFFVGNTAQGNALLITTNRTLLAGDYIVAPVLGAQQRLEITSYGSGTVTAFSLLKRGQMPAFAVAAAGTIASSSADSGYPLKTGGKYNSTPIALTNGQRGDTQVDTNGASVTRPFTAGAGGWSYAAASGGISNTTTAVTIKTANASFKNFITSLQISAGALGAGTEIAIRDGAGGTVLWRGSVPTAGAMLSINFDVPIGNATVNTLLEVVTLTATVTGAVYVNAQGFLAT